MSTSARSSIRWSCTPSPPRATQHQLGGKQPTSGMGVNAARNLNVHSIALQVPVSDLTRGGWSGTEARRPVRGDRRDGEPPAGSAVRRRTLRPAAQRILRKASRLGNPLLSEVVIPMGKKDYWNTQIPADDKQFAVYDLSGLSGAAAPPAGDLYPGAFPHLGRAEPGRGAARGPVRRPAHRDSVRADRRVPELHGRHPGQHAPATVIKPSGTTSSHGLLGGDLAGFPANGRRVCDDVVPSSSAPWREQPTRWSTSPTRRTRRPAT